MANAEFILFPKEAILFIFILRFLCFYTYKVGCITQKNKWLLF